MICEDCNDEFRGKITMFRLNREEFPKFYKDKYKCIHGHNRINYEYKEKHEVRNANQD